MNGEDEFKDFYESSFDRIFNYVYSRSSNFQDAEDIVSEVFTAVWTSWGKIERDNAIYFTFRIARNKTNDFLRKRYKIFEIFTEKSVEELADEYKNEKSFKNERKLKNILEKMLESLSERDKLLFRLKYKENKSFSEISEILNITKNNAKVINNRLIKNFKSQCQKIKL